MYTRSFYPEGNEKINVPNNYDGTAFMEKEQTESEIQPVSANQVQGMEDGNGSVPAGLQKMPILSGLFGNGSLFSHLNLKLPTIGTEEILLLATAAFLFFSKDGDKESALLLLFLLFIN